MRIMARLRGMISPPLGIRNFSASLETHPPQPCFEFFEFLARKPYLPRIHAFTQKVLVPMIQSGVVPKIGYLNLAMNCYSYSSRLDLSLSVLANVVKLGFQPDLTTFKTIINGYVINNQLREATRVFIQILEAGHPEPDLCTPFNTLVEGFCKMGDSDSAVKLLEEMEKRGYTDLCTFNTLVKGLCNMGDRDAAVKLLREMEKRGYKPDIISYNFAIDTLSKDKSADQAFKLYCEMESRGITPNAVTLTRVVYGLNCRGMWDVIGTLADKYVHEGLQMDAPLYNEFIDAFCKGGFLKKANWMMQVMMMRKIKPSTIAYTSILHGYCMSDQIEAADHIFFHMRRKSMVNIQTCNILLNGYCKAMRIDRALQFFQEISSLKLVPDTVTYNTLIVGLCTVWRFQEAEELVYDMIACGQSPDIQTLSILLDGLPCDDQELSRGMKLVEEMEANHMRVDIVVYTILIQSLFKDGKIQRAMDLFYALPSKGILIDVSAYTITIQGLCNHGLVEEAHEIFKEMGRKDCAPNSVTFNILFRGLVKKHRKSYAINLFLEMVSTGYHADQATKALICSDPELYHLMF